MKKEALFTGLLQNCINVSDVKCARVKKRLRTSALRLQTCQEDYVFLLSQRITLLLRRLSEKKMIACISKIVLGSLIAS